MLLQRFHITTLLQTLLVLLSLTSCVNDEFRDNVECPVSTGEPYYMAIQFELDANSLTRADSDDKKFEDGIDPEHAIAWTAGNVVILYDNNKKLIGIYDLSSKDQEYEDDDDIEAEYSYVAKISSNGDVDLPEELSCLVVLNASPKIYEELKGCTKLDDILKKIWKEENNNPENIGYADKSHRFFTMTNSVYYDAKKNEIHVAEKFKPEDHIYKTIAGAKRNPIRVNVERMVAKFSLTKDFKDGENDYAEQDGTDGEGNPIYKIKNNSTIMYCTFDNNGEPTYKEIEYRIRLTGWGINALETESYLFKQIPEDDEFRKDKWNGKKRSYWSKDPHYDTDEKNQKLKYPWQYRLAVNSPLDYYKDKYQILGGQNNNYLKNYSFEDLKLDNNDFSTDKVVYTPENTYDPRDYDMTKDFDKRTNLLAGTHLLVGAELLVDLENTGHFEAKDLYRDRKGVYYGSAKDCFWGLVRAFNYSLQSQMLMKYTYYKWDVIRGTSEKKYKNALVIYGDYGLFYGDPSEWNDKSEPDEEITGGAYALYYNNEEITYSNINKEEYLPEIIFKSAEIKDGDGKLLPWLQSSEDFQKLRIRNDNDQYLKLYDGATEIKYDHKKGNKVVVGEKPHEADNNDRKSLMFEWMGAVDHFYEGKMYYSAPVFHSVKSDQETQNVGDYGAVRNTWYRFKLSDIKNIGTPIDNVSEPIVPQMVKTNDQLNITIEIIPWHEFDISAPIL